MELLFQMLSIRQYTTVVSEKRELREVSPTISCPGVLSRMLPREGKIQQGTRVSLSLGHMVEFRRLRQLQFAGQGPGKEGAIKRKSSRNPLRISLQSLAEHQAVFVGGQTRTHNHDKERLLGICKVNNYKSSHNAEDI